MIDDPRGTYVRVDGRAALRFVRQLRHPVERVWPAVTKPDGLAAWFPCRIEGDLSVAGSKLRFVFGDDDLEVGEISTGAVLVVVPPVRLWFTWCDEEIRIDLESLGADACRLVFTDLIPDTYTAGAARTAAGWHLCLDALTEHLTSGAVAPPGPEPTPRFRELYDGYVADGVPHGAPIPGDAPGE